MTKSQAEKDIFLTTSAAWETLAQIFPRAKKQSLSQSSVFVRQMEMTRWRCCFYTKCTFVEWKPWVVACEWMCVCVCAGTGEKLTVCVRTVNYSVKVLGQEQLIGIPKLTTLVMSEGGKQRCTLGHTGWGNWCAMLGFVHPRLTVGGRHLCICWSIWCFLVGRTGCAKAEEFAVQIQLPPSTIYLFVGLPCTQVYPLTQFHATPVATSPVSHLSCKWT